MKKGNKNKIEDLPLLNVPSDTQPAPKASLKYNVITMSVHGPVNPVDLERFSQAITESINSGWLLQGGVSVAINITQYGSTVVYSQALVQTTN